jgi:hypothetical protein
MDESRKKITILVNNPATMDSRVIKQAESLAPHYEVTVVCRHAEGLKLYEKIRGVTYIRCKPYAEGHNYLHPLKIIRIQVLKHRRTFLVNACRRSFVYTVLANIFKILYFVTSVIILKLLLKYFLYEPQRILREMLELKIDLLRKLTF